MGVAGRLKNYPLSRNDNPRDWGEHRPRRNDIADDRTRCPSHLTLVPLERPAEVATLQELLLELRSEEFLERLIGLNEGREFEFFSTDPLVARLVAALRSTEARTTVEKELDELFAVYEQGRVFEHTEIVMALLYAIKMANVPGHDQILGVFTTAKPAEFRALRRFAHLLLRR